ncbi:hypothetical protein HPB52_013692 [Rhipicephalus sanguineus]|uniref:Reverse transcriptase domain-containing protein n=1 Tax=Rhipicephalus sanguineus TaxID=34632 RepID=A0A9D4PH76_RHISA|nr:hypothetical protein HPB52_013692 [Rhipicephalus sanguineus]
MEIFDDFQTWIKNVIGKVGSEHRPSRGPPRQKRKAWWDNNVATALATRKQLCRQHRFALRLGADEAEVQNLWACYLRAKKSMSALVQDRIRTINRKILKEIKEAGRDAGKKFWRLIQGQKATAQPWTDSLRDPEMGLEYRGAAEEVVALLKVLYTDTQAVVQWGQKNSHPVKVTRGLRQGCPMSPLIFMLYVAGLEQRLTESGLGFDLSYMEEGITNLGRIPALFYADDIVLLANNPDELQDLLNICG